MRYSSGKTKIAKQIANKIVADIVRRGGGESHYFVSLFCGGLSVQTRLAPYFENVICNDKQEYLIELYKALQNGWEPPESLSEEEYRYIKAHKEENKALTAFAGFGCSFGGKWFGGYGRHGVKDNHAQERSMCEESRRALLRDLGILKKADFICQDYRDINLPERCVIYADPPYENKMAAFGLSESFDTDEFWDWCRKKSANHLIYVSELSAPEDFECIWERPVLRQLANCNADNFVAREKLFIRKE